MREHDTEMIAAEKACPAPLLFVELDEEGVKAAAMEPTEAEEGVPSALPSDKEISVRRQS